MSDNKESLDSSDSCRSFFIRAELRFTLESSDLESKLPTATHHLDDLVWACTTALLVTRKALTIFRRCCVADTQLTPVLQLKCGFSQLQGGILHEQCIESFTL